jgi:hypothetical protein
VEPGGSITQPLVSPSYSGTLTTTVTRGDTTNPFGLNALTFTYVLSNNLGSHSVDRLSINGFDGFQVDASYQTPATGVIPAFVDREGGVGSAIGYSFASAPVGSGAVGPGTTSSVLVLQTNATSFVPSQAFVLNGFPASAGTFAPVPEPATLLLAAGAIIGLVVHRLSRRRSRR